MGTMELQIVWKTIERNLLQETEVWRWLHQEWVCWQVWLWELATETLDSELRNKTFTSWGLVMNNPDTLISFWLWKRFKEVIFRWKLTGITLVALLKRQLCICSRHTKYLRVDDQSVLGVETQTSLWKQQLEHISSVNLPFFLVWPLVLPGFYY